jgi:Right handed beta helix region
MAKTAKTTLGGDHRHKTSGLKWSDLTEKTSMGQVHDHTIDLTDYALQADLDDAIKRIEALEKGGGTQPPAPDRGPFSEPWFQNPPAPPAGLAAGTITLAQAIANTPAGGVLNAAARSTPYAEDGIQVTKLITILGGKPGQPNAAAFAPNNKPSQILSFLSPAVSGSVIEGFTALGMDAGFNAPPLGPEYGVFQIGGFDRGQVDRITIRNCKLSQGMHDLINGQGGSGHQVVGNLMDKSRKACVTISGKDNLLIRNNWASGANWFNFTDIGDSAGMKILFGGTGNVVTKNRFFNNNTRGCWFDSPSCGIDIFDNDADYNLFQGIFAETLHDSSIHQYRGHHNTLDARNQGSFIGGIACVCTARLEVYDFIEAWSGGGVTSDVNIDRTDDQKPHTGLHIHDGYAILTGPRPSLQFTGNPADTFWTGDNWVKNLGIAPNNKANPTTGTYYLNAAQQLAALQAAGLPLSQ